MNPATGEMACRRQIPSGHAMVYVVDVERAVQCSDEPCKVDRLRVDGTRKLMNCFEFLCADRE